jgi:hypothetical protein
MRFVRQGLMVVPAGSFRLLRVTTIINGMMRILGVALDRGVHLPVTSQQWLVWQVREDLPFFSI